MASLPSGASSATLVVLVALLNGQASSADQSLSYGPAMNYMLHCQGCHMEDGNGRNQFVPSFRDNVSRFVRLEEGRAYLLRVPGISQSLLDDPARAELMNWILKTYDPGHLPDDFEPFTATELASWRHNALSEPLRVRTQLLALLDSAALLNTSAVELDTTIDVHPPPILTVCLACHTLGNGGGNAMGPNLFGIVGKRIGSVEGFDYSPAMSRSGQTWTAELLDAFLESPARVIPGNFMVFPGLQNKEQRDAIVAYLVSNAQGNSAHGRNGS